MSDPFLLGQIEIANWAEMARHLDKMNEVQKHSHQNLVSNHHDHPFYTFSIETAKLKVQGMAVLIGYCVTDPAIKVFK